MQWILIKVLKHVVSSLTLKTLKKFCIAISPTCAENFKMMQQELRSGNSHGN